MASFECGQQVRVMSYDEICALRDSIQLPNGGIMLRINGFNMTPEMKKWCDNNFYVGMYNAPTGMVYLLEIDCWLPEAILEVVSDPGSYFGFKVGDEVVFRDWDDICSDGSELYSVVNKHMCEMFAGVHAVVTEIKSVHLHKANIEVSSKCQALNKFYLDTIMFIHAEESEPNEEINKTDFMKVLLS